MLTDEDDGRYDHVTGKNLFVTAQFSSVDRIAVSLSPANPAQCVEANMSDFKALAKLPQTLSGEKPKRSTFACPHHTVAGPLRYRALLFAWSCTTFDAKSPVQDARTVNVQLVQQSLFLFLLSGLLDLSCHFSSSSRCIFPFTVNYHLPPSRLPIKLEVKNLRVSSCSQHFHLSRYQAYQARFQERRIENLSHLEI